MNIFILTNDYTSPDLIKAADKITECCHTITDNLTTADVLILGPDLPKKIHIIGLNKEIEKFTHYPNWIYRKLWL